MARGRVLVDSTTVVEGDPKSVNSARTLALPSTYVTSLREMRARHAQIVGLTHVSSGYLAIDELGRPIRPERYSDHWKRLCKKAGVPVFKLHGSRHTTVSLMRATGIPDQIIAAFHGHDEQTMRRDVQPPPAGIPSPGGRGPVRHRQLPLALGSPPVLAGCRR